MGILGALKFFSLKLKVFRFEAPMAPMVNYVVTKPKCQIRVLRPRKAKSPKITSEKVRGQRKKLGAIEFCLRGQFEKFNFQIQIDRRHRRENFQFGNIYLRLHNRKYNAFYKIFYKFLN